jgi:glycine dehydrogenase subunit 1
MVDQLPNRGRETEMLKEMGFNSMEDLFADIPTAVRFKGDLPLRGPQSEEEIIRDARRLLGSNVAMGCIEITSLPPCSNS